MPLLFHLNLNSIYKRGSARHYCNFVILKENKAAQRLIRKIRSSFYIRIVAAGAPMKETYSDSIMDGTIIQNGLLAELLI